MPNQKDENKFEELRILLEQLGEKHGLNHPEVLHLSQELDKLHNEMLNI